MKTFKREEIAENKKWKTEHIFATQSEWEAAVQQVGEMLTDLVGTKEQICDSAENLNQFLTKSQEMGKLVAKIFGYASLREDEDSRDPKRQELGMKLDKISLGYSEFYSYVNTLFMEMGKDRFAEFVEQEPALTDYVKYFQEIFRYQPHTLSEKEEYILSQTSLVGNASEIYGRFKNTDLVLPMVKDENGEEIRLTESNYIHFAESRDRRVRKAAFEARAETYKAFENTLASMLTASVKERYFNTKIRKYNSTLEKELFGDEVPVEVYHNLIDTVRKNVGPMDRFIQMKRKVLKLEGTLSNSVQGIVEKVEKTVDPEHPAYATAQEIKQLEQIHMYDLAVPLIDGKDKKIPYEEAYQTMIEGLSVLGEDYTAMLKKAYDSGWIDVYPNEGKRSGAYSYGLYGVHPFVLLNQKDNMSSMFTLAHEMGHALHSYYSQKENLKQYSGYSIFVAEVASTVNEVLLMKHLLKTTQDEEMKKNLLNEFIEKFRGTFYTQTMFAEFEKIVHERVQNGEPTTAEVLNGIYKQLIRDYNGDTLFIDEGTEVQWARIPHFYRAFYVYKYATGFAAANSLAKQILEEGQPAVDRYLNFLKSGSTKPPLELLKDAGVDMSKPEPIQDAIDVFEGLVAELEKLV